jgi:hypothetical protein
MPYSIRHDFFDGASANSSSYTAGAYCVVDLRQMAVSLATSTTSASRLTLQASHEDGFTAAITVWSDLTAITLAGVYTIDPGMRWMRGLRGSQESLAVVTLSGVGGG